MKNIKFQDSQTSKTETVLNLKHRIKELETLVKYYEEQLLLSKKRMFAPSSEKSWYDLQLRLDSCEALDVAEELKDNPTEVSVKGHRRKKRNRKDSLPENVPVEEILCELPPEGQYCPACSNELHVMGREYRDEWVIVPAEVKVRRFVSHTYACRSCADASVSVPIIKIKWPKPTIKGSFASPESIAYIAYQKFVMAVPLYRQEQDWKRQGVFLSRQTMSNWLIECTELWFIPVFDWLKRKLLLYNKVIHGDETTLQVLKEPGKRPQTNSYLWVYRTSGDTLEPIVIAEYAPDRKGINPHGFLKGYSGYLHTDGYEAYHKLPNDIIVVGCWAHVRRKFNDALKIIAEKDRPGTDAMIGKRFCDKLFEVERGLTGLDSDTRHSRRQKELKPIIDNFYDWVSKVVATPKSPLGRAATYMFSQRKYLENVLLDGRLELSNNKAERTIKPFVISRKNFLFANTPRGAVAAATIFSLIETARETGVNPLGYLTYVLQLAPTLDLSDDENLTLLSPHEYKRSLATVR
jgi:transposase